PTQKQRAGPSNLSERLSLLYSRERKWPSNYSTVQRSPSLPLSLPIKSEFKFKGKNSAAGGSIIPGTIKPVIRRTTSNATTTHSSKKGVGFGLRGRSGEEKKKESRVANTRRTRGPRTTVGSGGHSYLGLPRFWHTTLGPRRARTRTR
ncbi:unnamed protein product, partial [Ectocarpus sp. 12 AP-2014]